MQINILSASGRDDDDYTLRVFQATNGFTQFSITIHDKALFSNPYVYRGLPVFVKLYSSLCLVEPVCCIQVNCDLINFGSVRITHRNVSTMLSRISTHKRQLSIAFDWKSRLSEESLGPEIARALADSLSPVFNIMFVPIPRARHHSTVIEFVDSDSTDQGFAHNRGYCTVYTQAHQEGATLDLDELIKTAVHEVGHTLNLRHSFNDALCQVNKAECKRGNESVMAWSIDTLRFSDAEYTYLALGKAADILPKFQQLQFENDHICRYPNTNFSDDIRCRTCRT